MLYFPRIFILALFKMVVEWFAFGLVCLHSEYIPIFCVCLGGHLKHEEGGQTSQDLCRSIDKVIGKFVVRINVICIVLKKEIELHAYT